MIIEVHSHETVALIDGSNDRMPNEASHRLCAMVRDCTIAHGARLASAAAALTDGVKVRTQVRMQRQETARAIKAKERRKFKPSNPLIGHPLPSWRDGGASIAETFSEIKMPPLPPIVYPGAKSRAREGPPVLRLQRRLNTHMGRLVELLGR